MGRKSRTKGHSFEREVARDFREAGYSDACRQLEYQENQCYGVDLDKTGKYLIQCKRRKTYSSISTIQEIRCEDYVATHRRKVVVPVLVTKADNLPTMAILPWSHLQKLISLEKTHLDVINDSKQGVVDPTPEEIEERAKEIREGWKYNVPDPPEE